MAQPSFLKKLADLVPGNDLKFLLHSHLHVHDPHRGVETVHASELTKEGFCPRFYALADVTQAKLPDEWLTTSDSATFFLGRTLQDAVVTWFAEMGRAVGHWKCVSCSHLHQFQPRPVKCVKCACRKFEPEEVRFVSAVSGASCGIDMLVTRGKPLLRVVEIKTIDKDVFKGLVPASPEERTHSRLPHAARGLPVMVQRNGLARVLVEVGDEALDPRLEVLLGREAGAPQQLAHEDREPDLYLVEPGGMLGGEVKADPVGTDRAGTPRG